MGSLAQLKIAFLLPRQRAHHLSILPPNVMPLRKAPCVFPKNQAASQPRKSHPRSHGISPFFNSSSSRKGIPLRHILLAWTQLQLLIKLFLFKIPISTFRSLISQYRRPKNRKPINGMRTWIPHILSDWVGPAGASGSLAEKFTQTYFVGNKIVVDGKRSRKINLAVRRRLEFKTKRKQIHEYSM